MKGNIGSYAGMTVGFLGWLIGLTVVCLASGRTEILIKLLPAGFLISVGLALGAILTMELVLQRFGRGSMFRLTLWGVVWLDVGIIWLLINHWLAPLIASDPGLYETMRRLGATGWTSDIYPLGAMAVGVVLLACAVFRVGAASRA